MELYKVLNEEMREACWADEDRRKEIIQTWLPMVGHLLSAMAKLPQHSGMVYRARSDLPEELLPNYQVGVLVRWAAFTSCL